MANSNTVTITLNARDDASRVIDGLTNKIENKLSKSFGGAALGANLMTSAITAGIQGLGNVLASFNEKLNESMNIQQANISTAGTLMKLIGLNYNDATGFIDEFSNTMSQVASSLPGATKDYVDLGKGIMDNLVPAFKALDGSFDKEGYKESLKAISRDAGYLASTSGVDSALSSMGISKFIGGASTKSLAQLKFFEANPAVLAFIEQEAKKLGKDIDKLTARERVEVLQKALRVPDEVIAASSKSISGLTEGFKSTLFDPQTGVFGLMRDLSEKAGNQSAFTALNESLSLILGEGGLFASMGATLKALGIELGDPMVNLRNGILWFNTKIKYINDSLRLFTGAGTDELEGHAYKMATSLEDMSKKNIDKLTNNLKFLFDKIFNFKGIGDKLGDLFNTGLDTLGNLNWGNIFSYFGVKLAEIVNESLKFLLKVDLTRVIDNFGKIVWGAFVGLGKLLSTLDWGVVLLGVGKLLGIAILGTIAVATVMLVAPVVASIGTLGGLIAAAVIGTSSVIAANWDKVTNAAKNFIGFVVDKWTQLTDTVNQIWQGVVSSVTNLFSGIQNKFNSLLSKIPGVSIPSNQPQIGIPSNSIDIVPNAASGNNVGLLMAAIRERKMAPSGSNIVVANSSETILNRSQTRDLITATRGNNKSFTIGSINISSNASNPKQVAKDVVNEIMAQLNIFNQSYVNAV